MSSANPYTFDRVVRIVFTVAIIAGCLYLMKVLKNALLPFFVAWLLAYMIHPLVCFVQNKLRIHNRMLAIVLTLFTIVTIISLLAWIFIPTIIAEINKTGQIIQRFISSSNPIAFLPDTWYIYIKEKIDLQQLADLINQKDWINVVKDASAQIWSVLTGSVNRIIYLVSWFIVLLYIVFILLDYDKIRLGFKNLIPLKYREFVVGILSDVEESMNRYFRGQTLIAMLVGILFSIGFLIIRLPLAIPLGLFIGALNLVPYLQIIGTIPTVLLCLLEATETGRNFWLLLIAALSVFIIVQLIEDIFLTPRIMGKVTGLNPAIILLSLSIWGTLMGVIGMIIALPLTTLMLSYYHRFILNGEDIFKKKYLASQTETEEETEEK